MSRGLKQIFTVTVVLCLALVATGFFLCARTAAKQGEETTIIPTTPAPAAAASGTVTVSVRIARVIQVNGDGTVRSNSHAVTQKNDSTYSTISL